ncbi:hypothetical protein B0H14DRAFT_2568942 [Mycena olivaceomarginata]|nr:hypothetical protein B0H14DRAFT_2568942 [Mycena olivaceomarginata]
MVGASPVSRLGLACQSDMTDEWSPVKFSKNDVEALEEIMEQYMEPNGTRLILPYLERLDAFDREKRADDGLLYSQKGGTIIKGMEEDSQKEEESLPLHLLLEASGDKSPPAQGTKPIVDDRRVMGRNTCRELNSSRDRGEFVIFANRKGCFRILDNQPGRATPYMSVPSAVTLSTAQ